MMHRLTDAARTLSHLVRDHLSLPPTTARQAGGPLSIPEYYQRAASIGYWVHGSQVKVLTSPSQFYDQLKDNIRNAKRRIVLSALYIGNGEQDLIQTLHTSLDANPNTHLTILVDYLRGTRGHENSVTALAPLLKAHPDRVRIALYHTPELTGWKKRWIPQRFNETIGLLHFKLFATDDELIISGANLSHDYFTNRQDRYMQITDPTVTSHYARLVDRVADLSFSVQQQPTATTLHPPTPCPVTQPHAFREFANVHLSPVLTPIPAKPSPEDTARADTLIVPTFQAHPLGIHQDEQLMHGLWSGLSSPASLPSTSTASPANWSLYFTSGYFNMTPALFSTIFSLTPFPRAFHVLTAAPQANGFYQSRGVSRFIPDAYSWLEERFLRDVARRARDPGAVKLSEYARNGWTFHAKGLWVVRHAETSKGHEKVNERDGLPVVTAIGSSNFGHRSARRDLEAQAIVVTRNEGLQRELKAEMDGLWREASEVSVGELRERDVHWLTKVTAWATKNMF
ncbi:hypothetical protein BCR44DRAFT_1451291 [Catenaria anguillulae PL171]|uniref:CDP-diacylglycerol--glycerol-3-phosphate 3-phosphatidyltransferase n=1 Tax=Catenaria anguillulae PL171 TaxID=765915 RepID=A0A1Y2H5Y2_9FUNG|nr:hypothetical protein BCR44DRAFT_1451291 [Catenaria anguillulae PL171]